MQRRSFLAGLIAGSAAPTVGWAAAGSACFIGAARRPDGSFVLIGLTDSLEQAFAHPLPARGHSGAAHQSAAQAVVFARRPGRFALVLDCIDGTVVRQLTPPDGLHFYGHGAYSTDGTRLLTTENDIATGAGRIGIWDARNGYTRIGEGPSHGIGPHEIIRLANGGFAIANGGIRTHPGTGREKLNLPDMAPNLTLLNADLSLREVVTLPPAEHRHSIRHIAEAPDGSIVMGLQWNGDLPATTSPLAVLSPGGTITRPSLPTRLIARTQGYIGSVAARATGQFHASAPRGDCLLSFDSTHLHDVTPGTDLCGLAADGATLVVSQGDGHLWRGYAGSRIAFDVNWDNHLMAVGI